jgi:hypothetical protein
MIRNVEMERFTVTSSKPFDVVVAAIKASIVHPNTAEQAGFSYRDLNSSPSRCSSSSGFNGSRS